MSQNGALVTAQNTMKSFRANGLKAMYRNGAARLGCARAPAPSRCATAPLGLQSRGLPTVTNRWQGRRRLRVAFGRRSSATTCLNIDSFRLTGRRRHAGTRDAFIFGLVNSIVRPISRPLRHPCVCARVVGSSFWRRGDETRSPGVSDHGYSLWWPLYTVQDHSIASHSARAA